MWVPSLVVVGADVEAAAVVGRLTRSASYEQFLSMIPTAACLRTEDSDPGNPWALGTSLVVGIYLEADLEKLPAASLTIYAQKGVSAGRVVRDELLGGEEGTYDIFMAWRCGCSADHRVIYRSVDDIPSRAGIHGQCQRCFHAPVRVVRRDDA